MAQKITYVTSADRMDEVHREFDAAIDRVRGWFGRPHPMLIGGRPVTTGKTFEDRSPIDTRILLGTFQEGDRLDAREERLAEAPLLESAGRRAGVADAGNDGQRGPLDFCGIVAHRRSRACPLERRADTPQVARAVVGEDDLGACGVTTSPRTEADGYAVASVLGFVSQREPFVEPVPAPSREHASRRARPSALNAASATW